MMSIEGSLSEIAKVRHSPASYPATSLALCLKKIQLACEVEKKIAQHEWIEQKELAEACGYKGFEGNSAPKGLIAALGHFGLVDRGVNKKVRINQDLISALSDEVKRAHLIQKAIMRPKSHQVLLQQFSTIQSPSKNQIAQFLLEKMQFAKRPAQILAANFQEDLTLLRSIEHLLPSSSTIQEPSINEGFYEKITLPSGAELKVSTDSIPTGKDWEFIAAYAQLKSKVASA